MQSIDYKKVFSKLSHIKALSHDQKFEQVVQNIILYSLINNSQEIRNEADLTDNIVKVYGISIRTHIVQSNLDRLLDNGDIIKDSITKAIALQPQTAERIKKRITDTNVLEIKVKRKWLYEVAQFLPEIKADNYEILWKHLTDYLFNVLEQHGVETLNLLNPSLKVSDEVQMSLTSILDKIIKENESEFSKENLTDAINQFILKADEERTSYLSQLVDATFTSFALTSDSDTVNFLNNRFQNLLLFLDTNFIFGILDLHKNNEDASAREILTEIKKNNFPFQLTFHPETLAEFKRAFDSKALFIRATKWSRETSRLALAVDGLSPLEELFHKENVENHIDPDVFLDKYDHVDLIVKDLGLTEYTVGKNSVYDSVEVEEDIEKYKTFYEFNKNRKPKTYQGFKHDIEVLREVRRLNPKKTKFLESKAFFLSSDYILSKFERENYKRRWEINFIISPSTFLQLIRPFVQNDYVTNKKFIDTFSIPDLRTFEIDYTGTRSKTLQILNDSYHDTSFQTKVAILRDQVLLEKFEKLNTNQLAQIELIENRIAVENQLLSQQKQSAEREIEIISQELAFVNDSSQRLKEKSNEEINSLKAEVETLKVAWKKEQDEKAYLARVLEWTNRKTEYCDERLADIRKQFVSDFKYSVVPITMLFIVTFLVFIHSKYAEKAKKFLVPTYISHRTYFWSVIILGLLVAIEVVRRTYITKKERVANGISWASTLGYSKRKYKLIESKREDVETEFIGKNPYPVA
ncbi:hypothetical protein LLH06_03445 [Mucilaginibacter daejeonensis]|uniref:hypothetical protein n=1 Tax=Mucilaginibacter daejeonensis TaxID=398049 RepID=UPI001D17100E|nr:hypothetical protein [Mucilaginibacter daejeonensis]UEG54027.1 hypothetical protein LLH06_03445 [Mucilaginibacter daejeonensis]